jgi:hypothetical protein
MKNLIRNGIKGIFSDADWKSGQPQRYGWQEEGKEKKELPKEIIQFIQRRRPPEIEPETIQDQMDELSQPEAPELVNLTEKKKVLRTKFAKAGSKAGEVFIEPPEIEFIAPKRIIEATIEEFAKKALSDYAEIEKKKVSKPKMKSNDNPKQKGRASGKRKPGTMETT